MGAITAIRTKLAGYPHARFRETPTSIEVLPQDESGFPVGLQVESSGFTVHFAGWHEHFESEQEALDCFAFGLSSACRLRVVHRGGTPTKWIVESQQNGVWVPDSETGLIFVPFWRTRRVVHLQNHLLPAR